MSRRPRPAASALVALAALALSGCGTAPRLPALALHSGAPEDRLRLFGGLAGPALTIVGPPGYCAAQGASRPREGFAVLGGCEDAAAAPALITVQAGGHGGARVAGNEDALAELLATAEGEAMLSSDGNPVRIDAIEEGAGLVRVRFHSTGTGTGTGTGTRTGTGTGASGLENSEWRAFLDLAGRLTTVSVRGFAGAPLPAAEGRAVLAAAVASLRAANLPEAEAPLS